MDRKLPEKKLAVAKQQLKWFLDLINLNVEEMPSDQVFRLWTDLRYIAYGKLGEAFIPDHAIVRWDKRKKDLMRIQEHLKGFLEKILAGYAASKEERGISGSGQKLAGGFNVISKRLAEAASGGEAVVEWIGDHTAFSHSFETKVLVLGNTVYPFIPQIQDKLLLEFVNSLSQFPLDLILTCQRDDCSGYFLKATEKDKRFCSAKCSWVIAARARRKFAKESKRTVTVGLYHEEPEPVPMFR
ncbi:MAG: hypothetical protein OEV28_00750 [Nitrospirota bacterium]|nr:hypothetical protein [Nitrospirota bacterium]